MSYRNDVEALAARHDALAAEVATKTRELDDARQLLDEAKQRARLPVLPNIRVASPCRADWNQMTGDDRVRACAACNKNVYNLSSMTRDEAEALIVAKEGRLCVRYFQRQDGTILLKDCAVGVKQKRKRRLIAAGAAALLGGGGFLAYKATQPEPRPREVLGGFPYPPAAPIRSTHVPQIDEQPEPIEMLGEPAPIEMMGDVAVEPPPAEIKGKIYVPPVENK